MDSIEMISLLSRQWATASDIQKIASCGRDSAINIRNKIIEKIMKSGKNLPNSKKKLVPMESVINYLDLNVEHLCNMAEKELKIKI